MGLLLLTLNLALAQDPPPDPPDNDEVDQAAAAGVQDRVKAIDERLDLLKRVAVLEREIATLDATESVADAEHLSALRDRSKVAASQGWWAATAGEPLSLLLGGGLLTFILGLLKHCHDRRRWAHERALLSDEQSNKWRTTYLTSALDSERALDHRLGWLRFLDQASSDEGLKKWAKDELQRSENLVRMQLSRLDGEIEAVDAQILGLRNEDRRLRYKLEAKRTALRKQADDKRERLLLVGPVNGDTPPPSAAPSATA